MASNALAVFDLDRTILGVGSGPVIARHLRDQGLGPDRDIPFADALYRLFNAIGETRPSMELAKLAVKASKGWDVDAVAAAADAMVDDLLDLVAPYAHELFDDHRSNGRRLVMATTTPEHFLRPFAERLGFDDVIATKWENQGGTYTGRTAGPFVWGPDKRDAVHSYASALKASLGASYAYSDSFYDAPLLELVGHPVAVNPDPRLDVLARLKGWPVRNLDVPAGVVKVGGREVQDWLRPFARPELVPNARFEFAGIENIPTVGGAIVCANHRSYFDVTAMSLLLMKAGRNARFLGKKEVFDAPVVGKLAAALGGIRVDRGAGSSEPLERAAAALRAGELVAIMPEGTIPRGPAFFDPVLKGRWGAVQLAVLAGVPIVPVGLWGTEKVWPRSSRLPSFNVIDPPTVSLTVGAPIRFTGSNHDANTKKLMKAISALLPDSARVKHVPTDDELRLTYPPGYRGDPSKESTRRPGTDG